MNFQSTLTSAAIALALIPKKLLVSVALLTGIVPAIHAEVLSADPGGFSVKLQADVPVPPPSAWAAMSDVGHWWDPEHTFSGDAHNLELQPVLHGCLCERTGLYAGVEHLRVIYAKPSMILRLTGALGPLQEFAVVGNMTWRFETGGGGSHVTLIYNVSGRADRPLDQWAPIVDTMLAAQLQRFVRFASGNSAETNDKESAPVNKEGAKKPEAGRHPSG